MNHVYEQSEDGKSAAPTRVEEPSVYQLEFGLSTGQKHDSVLLPYRDRLRLLLTEDLDFRDQDTGYASHDFHPFPAKFPPQLPHKFVLGLTGRDEVVLDPMMGSGTTIVEAILHGRNAVGFDIDPLARLITLVKTTPLSAENISEVGNRVISEAGRNVTAHREHILHELDVRWDAETRKFVDYWFAPDTQVELMSLLLEIQNVPDASVRAFLELVFSGCIITKSGGVSLAFDLAHTRPHRAKVARSPKGELILGDALADSDNPRVQFLTKTVKSAITEFRKRLHQNIVSLQELKPDLYRPTLREGDAQCLELPSESVDLIVTSPPYASNAIDYMRAHKFSLVWLGHSMGELSDTRKEYIGGESVSEFQFEELPAYTAGIVSEIATLDARKGLVLRRYYSEMYRVLREMYRVLRPGKASIVVVASSIMRGRDTETDRCLAEIGEQVGFEVPSIGVRHLDRNKRMLPAGMTINRGSQIQQRMHEEYVIGFFKPPA